VDEVGGHQGGVEQGDDEQKLGLLVPRWPFEGTLPRPSASGWLPRRGRRCAHAPALYVLGVLGTHPVLLRGSKAKKGNQKRIRKFAGTRQAFFGSRRFLARIPFFVRHFSSLTRRRERPSVRIAVAASPSSTLETGGLREGPRRLVKAACQRREAPRGAHRSCGLMRRDAAWPTRYFVCVG